MKNGDPPDDRNERSDKSSSPVILVSNFEKVVVAPNTSKGKVYHNMKSVEVDSQFLLHEEGNRERKHESICKEPKLIDEKRKHLQNKLSADLFIYFI